MIKKFIYHIFIIVGSIFSVFSFCVAMEINPNKIDSDKKLDAPLLTLPQSQQSITTVVSNSPSTPAEKSIGQRKGKRSYSQMQDGKESSSSESISSSSSSSSISSSSTLQAMEEKLLHINLQSQFTQGIEFNYVSGLYKVFDVKVQDTTRQKLINNPCVLLNENEKISLRFNTNSFLEESVKEKITPDLFKKLSQEYPLFFIRECTTCGLCRQKNPMRRDFSEKKIVENIKNNFSKDKRLNYVSFAPGDLLPDTIILSRLALEGYTKINVILIEQLWESEYLSDIKQMGEYVPLNISNNNPEKENWLRGKTYQLAQFVRWLQAISPEIKVIIYGDSEKYQQDCQQNSSLLADVIVAMDYIVEDGQGSIDPFSVQFINLLDFIVFYCLKQDGLFYALESINLFQEKDLNGVVIDGPIFKICKKIKLVQIDKSILQFSLFDHMSSIDPSEYLKVYLVHSLN